MSEAGLQIVLVGRALDRAHARGTLARAWRDRAEIVEHESASEVARSLEADGARRRVVVIVEGEGPTEEARALSEVRELATTPVALVVLASGAEPSGAHERELLAAGATELGGLEDGGARRVERALARVEARDGRPRAPRGRSEQAEQDLAFHVENSPLVVVEWGADFRCIRWTGQAERMFGWAPSEVLGRHPFEWRFLYDEDRREIEQVMARLVDGRERRNVHRNRNYRRDGSVGDFEWHNSVQLDEQGRLVSIFSLVLDVTERRAAERRLQQSESRFRTIAEAAPSIVFVLGGDGAYANSRWQEYFGVSFEEAMHRGWTGLMLPEDEPEALDRWSRSLRTGEAFEEEYRLLRHDGEARWHITRTVPLRGGGGEVTGWCGTITDVHNLKSAEEDLRRATDLLLAVTESAPDPIFAKDRDGRVLFVNQAAVRATGQRPDEVLGRTEADLFGDPGSVAALLANDRHVMSSGQAEEFEEIVPTAQGPRVFRAVKTPLRDREGQVVGVVGVSRDVTQEKRSDAALRASEARAKDAAERAEVERAVLDAILEAVPVGIAVTDAAGKIVRANSANELIWGRMPPVRSVADYGAWKGRWTDGSGRRGRPVEAHEWAVARALRGETVRDDIVEIEPFDRPGVHRTIVNTAAPVLDADGHVTGGVVAQMDISELVATEAARRESEERFRALADNITQLAWIAEPDGSIAWFNRRWLEYTGAPLDRMKGSGWHEIVHPAHRERVVTKLQQHIESGEPWEDTFPMRSASGEHRWFLTRAAPIRDESGEIVRWFGTNTDVTAQREAEEALRESARRKDEFLSMLAHELRNPLAPMRFAVALLAHGTSGASLERARAVIDRQVRHMARLIDDLLDVSRIARGRIELRKQICDLVALARQTAEDHRPRFEDRGVTLRLSTSSEPLLVLADPVRLTQMISNLLDNASKFTERGGQVELRVDRTPDGRQVRVVVEDTGAGIDPELLSRLFDPFAQADQGLARSKGGLGLGLALTRGLAELHGGAVAARSAGLGCGATFTICLPLLAHGSVDAATRPVAAEDGAPAAPKSVLIVEDNRDAADLLATLLETAGHHAAIARDGAEGLKKVHEARFDVVVCDLGLPGMSGYEVARALRRDPELGGIRLIALSGYARDEDRERSREAGFDEHIAKPVDLDALLSRLSP